jgi:hypothetical protein
MTLVQLGLDLSGVTTRSSLAKGLALAFARLGLEVRPRRESSPRPTEGDEGFA